MDLGSAQKYVVYDMAVTLVVKAEMLTEVERRETVEALRREAKGYEGEQIGAVLTHIADALQELHE